MLDIYGWIDYFSQMQRIFTHRRYETLGFDQDSDFIKLSGFCLKTLAYVQSVCRTAGGECFILAPERMAIAGRGGSLLLHYAHLSSELEWPASLATRVKKVLVSEQMEQLFKAILAFPTHCKIPGSFLTPADGNQRH
ncbi:unnamed protein product [Leuciscus chuanchicus]